MARKWFEPKAARRNRNSLDCLPVPGCCIVLADENSALLSEF
jgi:hypothetical protein